MDAVDRQVLNVLQKNARASLKDISKETFLSPPALSNRISRLEKEGYINSYQAKVNLEKLEYNIIAFVNVNVPPTEKDEFYPYVESCHNVLECNCVTGEYSMMLKTVFHRTQDLDRFINDIQKFGNTYTQIVFSTPIEARGIELSEDK